MTYVEGASLHQERGGSTVFARYAFNELVSFIAGWAILLDYVILIAVTALLGDRSTCATSGARSATAARRSALALAFIALRRAQQHPRLRRPPRAARRHAAWPATSRCRRFIVVLGLVLFFNPHTLLDPIHLGSAPTWSGLVFALTIAVIAFTSLESASGLAGEVRISRARRCKRHGRGARTATVVVPVRRASRSWRSPRCRCTAGTPHWRAATWTRR